jgi:two-component system, NtrC family, nitrogen regulation sensor histidine kinase NtrY
VSPRRRTLLILLLIGILLLFGVILSQTAFNLTFIQPDTVQQTLVLTALSALIFLLFVALTFVLGRNLLKLFAERRLGVLGSRFRTRIVLGGLVLSFLPVIFLFLFAYGLMNRSIDKWFSGPVEELKNDSNRVASLLTDYASENARSQAADIAANATIRQAIGKQDWPEVTQQLRNYDSSLAGGLAAVVKNGELVFAYKADVQDERVRSFLQKAASEAKPVMLPYNDRSYVAATAPLSGDFAVVIATPLPEPYTATLKKIEESERRYSELRTQRRAVRRFYMQLLMLLTAVVLFAATWLSIYVSRLVTRPVSALAEATQEISRGNLHHRVQVSAADELGTLVNSFNRMAEELENNRGQLEHAGRDLADANVALSSANTALEQRRREIETIVESIPSGVLSLDSNRRVVHTNRAFKRLFTNVQSGQNLAQLFEPQVTADLLHLMRKADRMGSASWEMEIEGAEGELRVEVTIASLNHQRQQLGYVVVFDDLSQLLKAQKQVAWREVARRVAHEIKNPLTPIALSAERIRRHLDREGPRDETSLSVIAGCAETISGAVETVRSLVDEFSALARFPTAQPRPADLNEIVTSALAMFDGRLDGTTVRARLAADLPLVMADVEGMRRVVANLVDNAAEAMQDSPVREVHISTALGDEKETVELVVADTGHGITRELKEKLFLPYFSTKERGTGLGLAIVSRIVEEHHGTVRVEQNRPVGAKFVIDLPVASSSANNGGSNA